jgi:hypothetical protein
MCGSKWSSSRLVPLGGKAWFGRCAVCDRWVFDARHRPNSRRRGHRRGKLNEPAHHPNGEVLHQEPCAPGLDQPVRREILWGRGQPKEKREPEGKAQETEARTAWLNAQRRGLKICRRSAAPITDIKQPQRLKSTTNRLPVLPVPRPCVQLGGAPQAVPEACDSDTAFGRSGGSWSAAVGTTSSRKATPSCRTTLI